MFEYIIKRADGLVSVEVLNELGGNGWELIFIMEDNGEYDYFFKRFIRVDGVGNKIPFPMIMNGGSAIKPPNLEEVKKVFENDYNV